MAHELLEPSGDWEPLDQTYMMSSYINTSNYSSTYLSSTQVLRYPIGQHEFPVSIFTREAQVHTHDAEKHCRIQIPKAHLIVTVPYENFRQKRFHKLNHVLTHKKTKTKNR